MKKGDRVLRKCMNNVGIDTWEELYEATAINGVTFRRKRADPSRWLRFEELIIKNVLKMSDEDYISWVKGE